MNSKDFELLMPVGQIEMAVAAIHNGADAIYVGFPGFNARGRSYDFELKELQHIIELCHLNAVKVNLAFNIVIFENELADVIAAMQKVLPLKPDALIVQDLGLVKLIKTICPDQVVHASTQMTVTNDLAIEFLNDLNIKRFVLGRENSLAEIRLIKERTDRELEVFVHGALCVSYSGQCFTSETLGGRSANRGQCAQSCRFSYDLIVDGKKKDLLDRNYLVSPKDLCGLSDIPELIRLGVKSFKVEGRLKSPDYVAQVARSYRNAIDRCVQNTPLLPVELENEKNKMEVEYSRGFFPGWLHGVNHQDLVDGRFGSHRGLEIGRVVGVLKCGLVIELNKNESDLESGDGLLWFEAGNKSGASIFTVSKKGKIINVEFSYNINISDGAMGSIVYLNHDKSQKKELEKSVVDRNQFKKSPVRVSLSLIEGQPLVAVVSDGRFRVEMSSLESLSLAKKQPLIVDFLFTEFSALTGTVFNLEKRDFVCDMNSSLFLNHKEIKNLRQKIFNELAKLRAENKIDSQGPIAIQNSVYNFLDINLEKPVVGQTKFNVLLRNKQQIDCIVQAFEVGEISPSQINAVYLDFEFGRDYKTSVEKIRSTGIKVGIATTRILKPQEYLNLKVIHSLQPDFILARNLGAIHYFNQVHKFDGPIKGDFSLNVTNQMSFDYLLTKGLSTVCLSYDLNSDQMTKILSAVDASKAEVTIHQSMPSFHMEHCVFAAFLSNGKSYRDCGKPCERHKVQLKDQFGNFHWIKPDQECRNTMYNSSAQTALPYLREWQSWGLGEIRFEALHEADQELIQKIKVYIAVLEGKATVEQALLELKTAEHYGLSPRQLMRSTEYQGRKKDHRFLELKDS